MTTVGILKKLAMTGVSDLMQCMSTLFATRLDVASNLWAMRFQARILRPIQGTGRKYGTHATLEIEILIQVSSLCSSFLGRLVEGSCGASRPVSIQKP